MDNIICPFCNEADFDLIGLKNHLVKGHCDTFNEIISIEQERHLIGKSSKATATCTCPEPVICNWKGVKRCSKCQLPPPA